MSADGAGRRLPAAFTDPETPPSAPIEKVRGARAPAAQGLDSIGGHPPDSTSSDEFDDDAPARMRGRPRTKDDDGNLLLPPIRTDQRMPPPGLMRLVDSPTPDEIKSVRTSSGQTQVQAAQTVGFSRQATWSDYEGGLKVMPPLVWSYYLLAVGCHPRARVSRAVRLPKKGMR